MSLQDFLETKTNPWAAAVAAAALPMLAFMYLPELTTEFIGVDPEHPLLEFGRYRAHGQERLCVRRVGGGWLRWDPSAVSVGGCVQVDRYLIPIYGPGPS